MNTNKLSDMVSKLISEHPPHLDTAKERAFELAREGPIPWRVKTCPSVLVAMALLVVQMSTYGLILSLAHRHVPAHAADYYLYSGDEPEYAQTAENLVVAGEYALDLNDPQTRAHRTPGYVGFYLPFRLLFGQQTGKAALVVFQVVAGAGAALVASLIASQLAPHPYGFLVAVALGALPSFPVIYNTYFLSDGLAASVATLCVYTLLMFERRQHSAMALMAGVLAILAVFLRPFLAPLLAIFAVYVFVVTRLPEPSAGRLRTLLGRNRPLAWFLVPILMVECSWLARNWVQLKAFIPLQTAGVALPPAEKAVWRWAISHGGDVVYWRPGATTAWLRDDSPYATEVADLPGAVTTPTCEMDRLWKARLAYQRWRRSPVGDERELLGATVVQEFDACRVAYQVAHPLDRLIVARLRLLRAFLLHAGPALPIPSFKELRLLSLAAVLKLVTALAYGVTLLTGLCGAWSLVRGGASARLVAAVALYPLVLFPFVIGYVEPRYITATYPLLVVSAACCSLWPRVAHGTRLRTPQRSRV